MNYRVIIRNRAMNREWVEYGLHPHNPNTDYVWMFQRGYQLRNLCSEVQLIVL